METILAGFAQFDNDIRAIRTVQGMQQRLREGIWPWKPPCGYLPPKIGKKTRPDQPDPRSFEPIQKAWKLFLTGAYKKADILRLLHTWGIRAYQGRLITAQTLDHLFANPYYAGVLHDPWIGAEYTGRHTPMVSAEEFARVQEIVAGRSNTEPHHRLNDDFPLRGLVRCPSCEQLMTGYFAQGRRQRYPYYKCFRAQCPTRTKSYTASTVHDEFSRILSHSSVQPEAVLSLVGEILKAHSEKTEQAVKAVARRKEEAKRLMAQLQELISMRTARMVSDEEFTIQRERLRLQLFKVQANDLPEASRPLIDTDISELTESLADLNTMWQVIPPETKRGFGEILLPTGFIFQQVRTAKKGLLFETLGSSHRSPSNVVDGVGFEPTICRL